MLLNGAPGARPGVKSDDVDSSTENTGHVDLINVKFTIAGNLRAFDFQASRR